MAAAGCTQAPKCPCGSPSRSRHPPQPLSQRPNCMSVSSSDSHGSIAATAVRSGTPRAGLAIAGNAAHLCVHAVSHTATTLAADRWGRGKSSRQRKVPRPHTGQRRSAGVTLAVDHSDHAVNGHVSASIYAHGPCPIPMCHGYVRRVRQSLRRDSVSSFTADTAVAPSCGRRHRASVGGLVLKTDNPRPSETSLLPPRLGHSS
jgi:hypothetical protein